MGVIEILIAAAVIATAGSVAVHALLAVLPAAALMLFLTRGGLRAHRV